MNRTVRCLAIFAIGVGAWACKGDPQSSLERGSISEVRASPARLFVDQGATVEVLVDARDQVNQAVEITSVSEAVGAGIAVTRDYQYQPVFDAGATDEASCTAIANRTNPTRLRYEVVGIALTETSFSVTINGSTTLDIPVTVTIAVSTGTLSNVTPASGEPVTITLPSPLVFDPALVADPLQWPGTVFIGVDDDGNPVDLATISDLQASVVTFQFPPNIVGPVISKGVTLPFNPGLPSVDLKTSEIFTSPQWPSPLAVTMSSNVATGFDVLTTTAGPGLIFGVQAQLYIGNADVGCPVDDSCRQATIISRSMDGTSIDATWPQDNSGKVYVTGMAAAAAPQFSTLDSETDQPIAIALTTLPVTVTQSLPSGVGLELVRLTLTDPGLQLTASSAVTSLSGGLGFMNVALDPAGQWIEYVPTGGSSSTATISGIESIASGLIFEFPASAPAVVLASTFAQLTTQNAATDITSLLPASGASILWYDVMYAPGGDIFGTDQQFYNMTGPIDHTFVLDWNDGSDIDILWADNPATAGFVCGGGATGAQPETSPCVLAAGGWTFVVNHYSGTTPTIMSLMITGN